MRLRQSLGSALAMPVAKLIVALLSDSRERRSQVPIYARFWREWAGLRRSEGGQLLFCCVLLRYLFLRHHKRLFFNPIQPRHRYGIQGALRLLFMLEKRIDLARYALRFQFFRHFL